jgi:hypothetical protein
MDILNPRVEWDLADAAGAWCSVWAGFELTAGSVQPHADIIKRRTYAISSGIASAQMERGRWRLTVQV